MAQKHDAETLRTMLERQLGPVHGTDLAAHLERKAVFVVEPSLALIDVAIAIANDEVEAVRRWMNTKELRRPTNAEASQWPSLTGAHWNAVIVQPYVLIQPMPDA